MKDGIVIRMSPFQLLLCLSFETGSVVELGAFHFR